MLNLIETKTEMNSATEMFYNISFCPVGFLRRTVTWRLQLCRTLSTARCATTSTERGEDAAAVARLESAVGQGRLP